VVNLAPAREPVRTRHRSRDRTACPLIASAIFVAAERDTSLNQSGRKRAWDLVRRRPYPRVQGNLAHPAAFGTRRLPVQGARPLRRPGPIIPARPPARTTGLYPVHGQSITAGWRGGTSRADFGDRARERATSLGTRKGPVQVRRPRPIRPCGVGEARPFPKRKGQVQPLAGVPAPVV